MNLPDNWLDVLQANRVVPKVLASTPRYAVHAKNCHCPVCERARDWNGEFRTAPGGARGFSIASITCATGGGALARG